MAVNVFEASAVLKLKDSQFTRQLTTAERRVQGFGGRLRGGLTSAANRAGGPLGALGRTIAGFGGSVPIAGAAFAGLGLAIGGVGAGIGATVGKFSRFESGIRQVYTLIPEASLRMRNQLEDDIDSLATEYGILSEDSLPALYNAISAGVPPENVGDFLRVSAQAAKAGVTDLTTSTNGLVTVMSAWGLEATEATAISDSMFTAVRFGRTTFGELSDALARAAPIAAQLGVGYRELNSLISAHTLVSGDANRAATDLSSMFTELGKEGMKAFDAFTEANGVTFPEFVAQGGDVVDGLVKMNDRARENGQSMVDMFGGMEAGKGAMILVQNEGGKVIEIMEGMDDATGSTQEAFDTMEGGLGDTWSRIKGNIDTALKEIGGFFAPWVAQISGVIAEKLPEAVEKLKSWLRPVRLALQSFFGGIHTDGEKGSKSLGDIFSAAGLIFTNIWDEIWELIKWGFAAFDHWLRPKIVALINFLLKTATDGVNMLLDSLSDNALVNAIGAAGPLGSALASALRLGGQVLPDVTAPQINYDASPGPGAMPTPDFSDIWTTLWREQGIVNPFLPDTRDVLGDPNDPTSAAFRVSGMGAEQNTPGGLLNRTRFNDQGPSERERALIANETSVVPPQDDDDPTDPTDPPRNVSVQNVMGATPEFIAALEGIQEEIKMGVADIRDHNVDGFAQVVATTKRIEDQRIADLIEMGFMEANSHLASLNSKMAGMVPSAATTVGSSAATAASTVTGEGVVRPPETVINVNVDNANTATEIAEEVSWIQTQETLGVSA